MAVLQTIMSPASAQVAAFDAVKAMEIPKCYAMLKGLVEANSVKENNVHPVLNSDPLFSTGVIIISDVRPR